MDDLINEAKSYAARGWRVFPAHHPIGQKCSCGYSGCQKVGKHPNGHLVRNGASEATTDLEIMTAWWGGEPGSNIGITTGIGSNLIVLDVDPRNGGMESLEKLKVEHGWTPKTLTSRTGGGGFHFCFVHPGPEYPVNSTSIAPGLEIKGEGGAFIAPPSRHVSGNVYEWEDGITPLSLMPGWLLSLAKEKSSPISAAVPDRMIVRGERHNALVSFGGTLRKRGLSPEAITAALLAENSSRCDPSLSESEVREISRSLLRYPAGKALPFVTKRGQEWQPALQPFSEITQREADWLWYPYLPLGRVTILEGDPGQGKSWFSLAVATSASLGFWSFNIAGVESLSSPCGVVYLTCEDDPEDTIKKRLGILGANQSRVFYLSGKARQGQTRVDQITLGDLPVLSEAIAAAEAKLVIVDPVQAYLPTRVEMNRAEQVRPVMASLQRLASEKGCAILIVRHLSKGSKDRSIYRGMGSIDFAAAARSVLVCGEVPLEAETDLPWQRRFAVAQAKNNLAPRGMTLEFELHMDEFLWIGTSQRTAEEILAPPQPENQALMRKAIEEIKEFFLFVLKEGEAEIKEVEAQAKKAGLDTKLLRDARLILGVRATKRWDGRWYWYLPQGGSNGEGH